MRKYKLKHSNNEHDLSPSILKTTTYNITNKLLTAESLKSEKNRLKNRYGVGYHAKTSMTDMIPLNEDVRDDRRFDKVRNQRENGSIVDICLLRLKRVWKR